MAYTLVTAYLVPKGKAIPPQQAAIGSMNLYTLFNNYSSGTIVLSNVSLAGPQYVDLVELQLNNLPKPSVAFNTWLGTLGTRTIPASTVAPSYVVPIRQTVTYQDAWDTGYHLTPIPAVVPIGNMPPASILDDALLTSPTGALLSVLATQGLYTVNGLLHRASLITSGIQLSGAGTTLNTSKSNTCGILNFTEVGTLQQLPITATMIGQEDLIPYTDSAIINLSMDLTGKYVLFSLGGFLHGEFDIVTVINRTAGIIKLQLHKIDLVDRLVYSIDKIDLSKLQIRSGFGDETTQILSVAKLQSPATIFQYLQIPQTFAIVVNNPNVYIDHSYPQNSGLYGRYTSLEDPQTPIVDARGRFVPYLRFPEGRITSYITTDDEHREFLYKTVPLGEVTNITNGYGLAQSRSYVRFLKIYTQ